MLSLLIGLDALIGPLFCQHDVAFESKKHLSTVKDESIVNEKKITGNLLCY